MSAFRVLVVDDSAYVRRALSECLQGSELVGELKLAEDGLRALEILDAGFIPDYIVLDLVMPNMNGFSFLKELSRRKSRAKVIVFSTFSRRGAQETVEALLLGAIDFVPKPDKPPFADACKKLLEKFQVFASLSGSLEVLGEPEEKKEKIEGNEPAYKMVLFVGSHGALPALRQIFSKLEPHSGVAYGSVFHLPAPFYPVLGARLHAISGIPSIIVEDRNPVLEMKNYMPSDGNMVFSAKENVAYINRSPFGHSQVYKPSIDRTLISAAPVFRERLLVVFLSGMGNDGVEGAHDVKMYGGKVVVQDPETAPVPTLPKMVSRRVSPDAVLELKEIPSFVDGFSCENS